ncbi:DUF4383 domain-containing protein [Streptomyces sp. NPDC091266]|uniref:DUF4383 domain-containing protein n=1 Tax=Streptomyces sp. NPDC091266 TaxID=3365978 RepID=UPI003828B3DC
MATGATGHTLHKPTNPLHHGKLRHTRLDEHLPTDHSLSKVYRVGAGLMGLVLLAFGILGLIDKIGFFDTGGDTVAGLNTNGALSVLSIVVGVLLFAGMVIGGNFASTLNIVFGVLFLLSGFVNLALLQTDANFLAFEIQNVLFSFIVGLMLLVFGMYGRVSGGLPHDNPYWRARHPQEAERLDRRQQRPLSGAAAARRAALGETGGERGPAVGGGTSGSSGGSEGSGGAGRSVGDTTSGKGMGMSRGKGKGKEIGGL